ncbi:hypothetical protein N7539_000056 [Penicillium diatomitis]|uniref:Spindle pole body component n=1 Tax=Penicillium diatomitis TaxID=2819901 RepID=A0A9W9XLU1_9EURO|nr:uncharacterized protein N7539_000056 [Penicillium diatomitis]KAJ5494940.1 hypothetical protein N7539_000056 [Penicillium diatomitis]
MEVEAINSLIEELITKVARLLVDAHGSQHLKGLKHRVKAALRLGVHGRTNQFEVTRQLEGLQEKFQVLNRDELAEGLRCRLLQLEQYSNSWHPEILSFLLQLSDRPALLVDSKVSRAPSVPNPNQPLSWADLGAHGVAYSDEEIWDDVDFGPDSSDDELASEGGSGFLQERPLHASTAEAPNYQIPDNTFVDGDAEELLPSIENAQFWRPENAQKTGSGPLAITELQLARETIFMLQALPTSIFEFVAGDILVDRRFTLTHASELGIGSLLEAFAQKGIRINLLRQFTNATQQTAYMQTFSQGVGQSLRGFDEVLCTMQRQYLSPGSIVSLLQLYDTISRASHQLLLLSELVSDLEGSDESPMRCLDLLFDLVCMTEASGDEKTSKNLGNLFLSCFKTYAQSVQSWMADGQIDSSDTAFFVKRKNTHGDLRTIWYDWFEINEGPNRQNIPKFLQPSLQKVFTTGKSKVFLRNLNALPEDHEANSASTLFDMVFSGTVHQALPFSVRVENAFNQLVDFYHSTSAGLLQIELDSQCGIWHSFVALKQVYLGEDISALAVLDGKIFDLIDRGRAWDDRFLLTEVARSAFSVLAHVDVSRVVVRTQVGLHSAGNSSSLSRSVQILESISIDYVLPWALTNIVPRDAIRIYQRISAFLMQIRRSKYALVKHRIRQGRNIVTGEANEALVCSLYHNLTWFLDTLYSHLAYVAISASTAALHQALHDAQDLDAIIAAHDHYILSLEEQCLLSQDLKPIHQIFVKIMDLAIQLVDLQTVHAAEGESPKHGDIDVSKERRRRKQTIESGSDSDSELDDGFEYEQTLTISFNESSYDAQLRNLRPRFESLISSVVDSLKGIARSNGHSNWNILAERLEWRLRQSVN